MPQHILCCYICNGLCLEKRNLFLKSALVWKINISRRFTFFTFKLFISWVLRTMKRNILIREKDISLSNLFVWNSSEKKWNGLSKTYFTRVFLSYYLVGDYFQNACCYVFPKHKVRTENAKRCRNSGFNLILSIITNLIRFYKNLSTFHLVICVGA